MVTTWRPVVGYKGVKQDQYENNTMKTILKRLLNSRGDNYNAMTNQTIEQAVEEFEEKFGSADYGINKFRQFDTDGIFLQDGTDWLRQALQAQREAGAEEERERIEEGIKENVALQRVPSDITKTKQAIDELMAEHYEPIHEEGQTCWCNPTTTVKPSTKKVYIDHNEQRVLIRRFLEDNFVSKEDSIASLAIGSNQARRLALQALTPPTK